MAYGLKASSCHPLNQSNCFKDMALNVDTNKNQNLELFLNAADFHFCFGTHVPSCTCVHQQMLQKSIILIGF